MTEGREQRRDPRVPLVLRVEYPGVPSAVRDATENLSAGGLFIRTERELDPGTRIPLQISFPGLLAPFEVEVEVVRRRPPGEAGPAGVAVQIPPDRAADRQKLAQLAETARSARGRTRGGYRVLVVEDNPHVVEMYEYALRRLRSGSDALDVSVEFATNGQQALERLAAPPAVDLVLTDLFMPVMDGFALIERIRADPRLSELPIMVISAGAADARTRAIDLGVDVYLQKPVQFVDVMSTVRTLLHVRG
ncbi:response regulator receiver modulated PilZ sensor protein [Anaeromyxobacter dehalogenans 2CP-1]|uniref:Response regulator receiver modulated PilZ sensor protein n=1 Tax=Anaeromyxobacter dehalogenans (strain ATCC BAA-258 / DSM 21875 / 2CP-1) TaxID=455488 RepID=B8JBR5_ANAD2|nr:TIGR02266 family protein [Anaeromyxobacter dehalogenans]ACL67673.1 response regulator receiver modulated PilZ sensor protein [Anaeromyxobacter dehalogenans 2CP-1]